MKGYGKSPLAHRSFLDKINYVDIGPNTHPSGLDGAGWLEHQIGRQLGPMVR